MPENDVENLSALCSLSAASQLLKNLPLHSPLDIYAQWLLLPNGCSTLEELVTSLSRVSKVGEVPTIAFHSC